MTQNIPVVKKILSENDLLAEQIRGKLTGLGVFSLNFMASPGGGKTSVIVRTVKALKDEIRIGVMDGDIVEIDLEELAAMGIPVSLINTGGQCHLDANQVLSALPTIDLSAIDLLIVENVGNLICPAAFDLGVDVNVVIASVPEGDDKPYKYPSMFKGADVLLLNKMDVAEYFEFRVDYFREGVEALNPGLQFFPVSAKTGEGFDAWLDWLRGKIEQRSTADA
ncbi:MAG: hydrogenase nickel incorporation protein HypB [Anaerolineae bacterium]|nr:hydrogenase nickel incorporation protein HypB [Anaerolineae bacterium]